jgi:hypothetical protein
VVDNERGSPALKDQGQFCVIHHFKDNINFVETNGIDSGISSLKLQSSTQTPNKQTLCKQEDLACTNHIYPTFISQRVSHWDQQSGCLLKFVCLTRVPAHALPPCHGHLA